MGTLRCAAAPSYPCYHRESDACKATLVKTADGACALPHISCCVDRVLSMLKVPTACIIGSTSFSRAPVLSHVLLETNAVLLPVLWHAADVDVAVAESP